MKLLKRVICFMLILAMALCNNAVLTFAESCNRTETGQNEKQNDTAESVEEPQPEEEVQIDDELQTEDEIEEEEPESVCDARERADVVIKRKDDFSYIKGQNKIIIVSYLGSDTDVVIPEEIEGCPVVEISYRAFQFKSSLETVVIPDSVESIGSNAFEYCKNLTDVTFSNNLRYIDDYAFQNCEKLQTINLPEGLQFISDYVFLNCTQLQTVNFPEGLQSIGNDVFSNCKKLQTIDLPEGLISVGSDAFSGSGLTEITFPKNILYAKNALWCSNVEKVTFADGTTKIPESICDCARALKVVELPETVTTIGSGAFAGCSMLETISIPDTVTDIEASVFDRCSALEAIILPEGLKKIGGYCFRNSGITSVTIPSTLTEGNCAFQDSNLVAAIISPGMERIPNGLFFSAKKLENISIPDSVKEVGASAFALNESLTDIVLPADLTIIRGNVFYGCIKLEYLDIPSKITYLGSEMLGNTAVKEITVPNTVEFAGNAFGESKIEKVVVESGMTKLPDGIFSNTKFLSTVILPDTLTEIGQTAFYKSSISEIHLPEGVTEIGKEAFGNCSNIEELTLPDGVRTLGGRFLAGSAVTDITVPAMVINANRAFQDSRIEHADVESGMAKLPDGIFYGAKKLVQVELPDTLTEIGQNAFYDNAELVDISFPDGLLTIGDGAFGWCVKMDTITLPSNIKRLGRQFITGTKITSIRVPASVTFADGAFASSSLEEVVLEDEMKSLPSGIFVGLSGLSDITLPENLTSIGERAFYNCSKLEELDIPKSVTTIGSEFIKGTGITSIRLKGQVISADRMFSGSKVTTVELPAEMTNIPDGMFYNATELTGLVLPENITRIGSNAFYGCKLLTEIVIPKKVTTICGFAFSGSGITEINIPCSVTYMYQAFSGSNIEKVNLDENLSTIPYGAFSGASKLTDIILPEGLKKIENYVFEGTTALISIEFPETLTTIGNSAFRDSGVEELYIPASITSMDGALYGSNVKSLELDEDIRVIPDGMFCGAGKLTSIHLPEKLKQIGERAFTYSGITSVTIPKTVTSMKNAFSVSNVESVVFEEGCDSIPEYALANAQKLTEVTIPEGVVKIGNRAFYNDTALSSICLPDTLETIEIRGFCSCSSLKSVYWPDQLVDIGPDAFLGVSREATAYVTENSPGMYAAIQNGLYVVFTGRYEDGSAGVLDPENSSYYYTTGKLSYGKYTPFYIDYMCNKELFAEIQNPYIEVVIPEGMKLSLEYIELDGEYVPVTDGAYDSSKHILRIPVSEPVGHISIMMKTESTGKVATYASLVYEKDGEQSMEVIGTITLEMLSLSMECSDTTTNGKLYIQGMTNPLASVYIYVNDEKTDTVKADAAGDYSTTIQLTKRGDNVVKAVLVTDSKVSVTKHVEYEEDAIEVTKFMLYYRTGNGDWKGLDLLEKTASGKRVVSIKPNLEQRFVVAFSDNDKVKKVKIVSTKNGKKKYMVAKKSKSGEFIAQGFFDPDNSNYVPGQLSISYTLDDNTKKKFDIKDPAFFQNMIHLMEKEGFIGNIEEVKVTQNGYKQEGDKSTYDVTVSRGEQSADVSFSITRTPIGNPSFEELKNKGFKKAITDDGSTVYVRYNKDNNSVEYITNDILENVEGPTGKELWVISLIYGLIDGLTDVLPENTGTAASMLTSFFALIQQDDYFNRCIENVEGNPDLTAGEKVQIKNRIYAERYEDWMIFAISTLVTGILIMVDIAFLYTFLIAAIASVILYCMDEDDYYADIWLLFSVDPSGYVYEGVENNRIAGATAEIYYKEKLEDKQAVHWDASEYSQTNPLLTNEAGEFAWDVPEGYWQVVVTKEGYETAYSEWMEVPPERTGVAIPLVSTAAPEVESISADTNAAVITFSQYMNPDKVSGIKLTSADGGEVAYKLLYDDSKKDKDGNVFARTYKLVYIKKQEVGSELTVSVPDTIVNYAGSALEAYQGSVVVVSPCSIASEDSIQMAYDEEKTVAVEINNYREEFELTCVSSSPVGLEVSVSSVNANGKAELTLSGVIPGTYQVELAVAGTDTIKTIAVTVQEAEMEGESEKEETGTGSTEEGNGETGTDGTEEAGESSGTGNEAAGSQDTGTGGYAGGGTPDSGVGGNTGDGTGSGELHNHTEKAIVINRREATYTENGYTGDTVCSVCGKIIKKGEVISKKTLAKPAKVTVKSSKKNTLVVNWKKSRAASGYEIQYAVVKGFRKVESVKVKSSKTKKTIKKLTSGKNYYIRIRAYKTVKVNGKNKRIYSGWVTCKKVKVK